MGLKLPNSEIQYNGCMAYYDASDKPDHITEWDSNATAVLGQCVAIAYLLSVPNVQIINGAVYFFRPADWTGDDFNLWVTQMNNAYTSSTNWSAVTVWPSSDFTGMIAVADDSKPNQCKVFAVIVMAHCKLWASRPDTLNVQDAALTMNAPAFSLDVTGPEAAPVDAYTASVNALAMSYPGG